MGIGEWAAIAATLVALFSVPLAFPQWKAARIDRQASDFRKIRRVVRSQQSQLSTAAWALAENAWKQHSIPMLTEVGWVPPEPVDLSKIGVGWVGSEQRLFDRSEQSAGRASKFLPPQPGHGRLRYSDALRRLDSMEHLFNGDVYRLCEVTTGDSGLQLGFVLGNYFGFLDTSEVLAYEVAANDFRGKNGAGSYRASLKSPFDLWARATSLGVLTLTVRRGSDGGSGFYMHRRDGKHVVVGSEELHVVPAGEFAPADLSLDARERDFDIWHTIMREFAEEFLGVEEAKGQGGQWLDYDGTFPYKQLNEAREAELISVHALGIALDPLTWKPELLTVCIIEAQVFDSIFRDKVQRTDEGTIIVGARGQGLPFDQATVDLYAENPATRRGARSCLLLAWEHRALLGLTA